MAQNRPVPELDRIIHERARLLIMTYLAGSEEPRVSFNELKLELELSAGNLSIQLRKLEEAGYLKIMKEFRNNKPHTSLAMTPAGEKALRAYLKQMDAMIQSLSR